jgi:hypothetical protein
MSFGGIRSCSWRDSSAPLRWVFDRRLDVAQIDAYASEQTDRHARASVADEQIVDDPLQL